MKYVESDSYGLTVTVDEINDSVELNYVIKPDFNTVYQWILEDVQHSEINEKSIEEYAKYCLTNLDTARVIQFEESTNNSEIELYSSAGADLTSDLVNELGNEYDKQLYSHYLYGHQFYVRENMMYSITYKGNKKWSGAISISSLATTLLGIAYPTSKLITALSIVFAVEPIANAIINPNPSGINIYNCQAIYVKYINIDSDKSYNNTYKVLEYQGYEDASLNSPGRAAVDFSSKEVYYQDSESYYNDQFAQIDDAYANYNRLN